MNLSDMVAGTQCVISSISDHSKELKSRLYTLGILPGVEVKILRFAPLGDPIQLRVGTSLISIRKHEAGAIEVEAKQE